MALPLRSETVPERITTAPGNPRRETGLLRPQRVAKVLMLAMILGVCDQNYWLYSNVDHYFSGYWMPFIHGVGAAPEQYRIAVKMLAWWLVKHLSWGFRHGYTLLDTVAAVPAVLLVHNLLERRFTTRTTDITLQWFSSIAFVGLVGYYMLWEGFFFRPETLPTLGLTAIMAWLWTRPDNEPRRADLTVCSLVAAAAAQAWIRADVPCALNAGVFLACLMGDVRGISLSRRMALITSGLCVAVAAGSQWYIMRVLYPQANYANVPEIMLAHDLHQPLTLPPFLIFMLPVGWTAMEAWRQRATLDTGSKALLLGASIYFVLWIVMGKLDEVRIFLPFAVVLIPLTVQLAIASFRESPPSLSAATEKEA